MNDSPRTLAFVMDPIESIDVRGDTTFVMMLEALDRGHRVLYVEPRDLGVSERGPVARARPVLALRREPGNHVDLGPEEAVALDEAADLVFQRKDPPVDGAYVVATQILSLCRRALVLNRPQGILTANEKLYAMGFPDLMPPTRVTHRIADLKAFMAELGGEMIVKPLDGRGGEGIFHVSDGDRNLVSILEQSTAFETRPIMAQQYLPDVRKGDKRILLVDGEPIGAVLRVPSEGEHRANFHVGGTPAKSGLDAGDLAIVERLAPSLRRDGLFFVGIDVIGGRLTEVNVTSPTGVQEVNTLEGRRLEAEILDGAERKLAEFRA
ncbi:MAG: glutathione synthase [Myxococcota bacterium]